MAEVFPAATSGSMLIRSNDIPGGHAACDAEIARLRARLAAFEAHRPAVLDALRIAVADTAYSSRAERFTAALAALDGSREEPGDG